MSFVRPLPDATPLERALWRAACTGGVLRALARSRSGSVLPLVAVSILPLLALMGSAIDIGQLYFLHTRMQQACDAGTLAARKQIASTPNFNPETDGPAAIDRGRMLFRANFSENGVNEAQTDIAITINPDLSVQGSASMQAATPMMQMFGSSAVDLAVSCKSQLRVTNADIMLALDVTGSMNETLLGDTKSKLDTMRDVVRSFWQQTESAKVAGSRIRYGFVPYSTNVNVGALLKDEWVVPNWTYQSRTLDGSGTKLGTFSYFTGITPVSGTMSDNVDQSEPATFDATDGKFKCKLVPPPDALTAATVKTGSTSEPFAGPPSGTRTIDSFERTQNGTSYRIEQDGKTCKLHRTTYTNYVDRYDYVTDPALLPFDQWVYDAVPMATTGWRTRGNGCIEERSTYEITDYAAVDENRALDLDIDRVPDPNNPDTQWRPAFPEIIYDRQLTWLGTGNFSTKSKRTNEEYVAPLIGGFAACPPPAAKLRTWSAAEIDGYLGSLAGNGSTYHDIGMIWAARLISPTGLFAAENVDAASDSKTARHIIFLTDGQTAPLDLSYGSYGVEPLDQRRWSPASPMDLKEVVENRFSYACHAARNRNITVWLIAFGTELNPVLADCAGSGHAFFAANASELNKAFAAISRSVGSLRISQ